MQVMKKKNKGFTLVELIVVIGILALLAVLGFVAFSNINAHAARNAVRADVATLASQLNTYNAQIIGAAADRMNAASITSWNAGAPGADLRLTLEIQTANPPGPGTAPYHIVRRGALPVTLNVTIPANRRADVLAIIQYTNGVFGINETELQIRFPA